MLKLQSLGGLAILDGDRPLEVQGIRKPLAILACVAAAREVGVSRDRLQALFWPESDGERARSGLKQALYLIRRALGVDPFVPRGLQLSIDTSVLETDLATFQHLLSVGEHAAALDCYGGPFLDGVYLKDLSDFEHWVESERARLAGLFAGALEQVARFSHERANLAAAAESWRRRSELDPLDGRVALEYMRALASAGAREQAVRFAQVHTALVRQELGVPADARVAAYRDELAADLPAHTATQRDVIVADSRERANASIQQSERADEDHASPAPNKRGWRAPAGVAVVASVVALLSAGRLLRPDHAPSVDPSRVLVPVFINRSGDSTLDALGSIAADWVTQGLSQAEVGKVVDGPTAFEVSRVMLKHSPPESLWTSLSRRTRAAMVLSGTLHLEGDSVVFEARVIDMRDGAVLRTVPPIHASTADPMRAVEVLRERAVGAVATILDPGLASVSGRSSRPPLIEAYQDFVKGLAVYRRDNDRPALALFLSAARTDSTFMLPLMWAYLVERNYFDVTMQPSRAADSILAILESHRTALTPIDRYALDAFQAERNDALKEQRLRAIQRVSALAPASNWSYLEANLQVSVGRMAEARAALERIDPEHGWAASWLPYWNLLALTQHQLRDYTAELETARRAMRNQPVAPGRASPTLGLRIELRALVALGRIDSALALLRGMPFSLVLLEATANELRAHGHRRQSDSLYREGLDFERAETAGRPYQSVYFARYAIQAGSLEDARVAALRVLADSARPGQMEAHAILGMVAANRGDRAAAESELKTIDRLKREHDSGMAAGFQAVVAGYLHDRQLVLRYFAEMEACNGDIEPAVVATHRYRGLLWLDGDPAVRRPYITGSP